MAEIKLIAGLGNPGKRYQNTRHNIGFMLLDRLVGALPGKAEEGKSWRNHLGCLLSEMRLGSRRVIMIKPQSYMNASGEPVAQVLRYLKMETRDLLVVHDDIDLDLGVLRIKKGSGDGGHKGVRSIISCVGSGDFVRLKLGIGRPAQAKQGEEKNYLADDPCIVEWVLSPFEPDEKTLVGELLDRAADAAVELCRAGIEAAQGKFNRAINRAVSSVDGKSGPEGKT